jgi:hypothetical protein
MGLGQVCQARSCLAAAFPQREDKNSFLEAYGFRKNCIHLCGGSGIGFVSLLNLAAHPEVCLYRSNVDLLYDKGVRG